MSKALFAKKITVTTASGGGGDTTLPMAELGWLYAVEWIDGDFSDGVDATLSCVNTESGVDKTLLTLTDANSDAWYYPRVLEDDNTATELSTYALDIINGDLKLAVTDGGDTKTGGCIVYYLA